MTAPRQSRPSNEAALLEQAKSQQHALSLRFDDLLAHAGLTTEHVELVVTRASRDPRVRRQLATSPPAAACGHGSRGDGPAAVSILVRNPRALRA